MSMTAAPLSRWPRPNAMLEWLLARPVAFAIAVMAIYAALLLPCLWRAGFDPSVFIVAGDQYVTRQHAGHAIIIRHASAGYDGQFYYRLALAPFDRHLSAFGVTFDDTAKRMRRIVYPLLVHIVTLGRPALVPAALVLVNLSGLGVIAACAVRLGQRLQMPRWFAAAMVAWPGFLVTLIHDTTEITAAACLIAALYAYVTDRRWFYAVLAAAATLTRETSLLAVLAIAALEAFRMARAHGPRRAWAGLAPFGLAALPYLVWRSGLALYLPPASPAPLVNPDIGWPLLGALGMLARIAATRFAAATPTRVETIVLATAVTSAICVLTFCCVAAWRGIAALRDRAMARLAAPSLAILALMSLLTAAGPWIEPTSFFRAFTECYVTGLALFAWRRLPRWLSAATFLCGGMAFGGLWVQTLGHIR